ncbi:MAG: GFA family protein [Pseudomonadales bacterium]|nr:GFA family protein [Pseudomonadales bacterium]
MPYAGTGRCVCGALRYALREPPLFTHACHCLDCQRRTDTAFAMTTFVMGNDLVITHGRPLNEATSARSTAYSCPSCHTVIYIASSEFPSVILRPGTLDDPAVATPQAHIWVRRKQAWLDLPDDVPQFAEQYDRETTWPASSLARLKKN